MPPADQWGAPGRLTHEGTCENTTQAYPGILPHTGFLARLCLYDLDFKLGANSGDWGKEDMTVGTVDDRVIKVVRDVLEQKGTAEQEVGTESNLYEEGLGFDSLDTATLSAALEREFSRDPYTEGQFPRTVGELIQFIGSQS